MLGVIDWVTHGDLLRKWVAVVRGTEVQSLDMVNLDSHIGQLWLGIGIELGQMLKLSEALGTKAWTKDRVILLRMQQLDLEAGDKEGDLVSTGSAMRKLDSTLLKTLKELAKDGQNEQTSPTRRTAQLSTGSKRLGMLVELRLD